MATESVATIRFPESSQAYQALSELRGLGENLASVELRSAALVERTPDGTLRAPEQSDEIIGVGTAAGGLIGMLAGVLGGPLGVLLGFGTGALVGGMFDVDRATSVDSVRRALPDPIVRRRPVRRDHPAAAGRTGGRRGGRRRGRGRDGTEGSQPGTARAQAHRDKGEDRRKGRGGQGEAAPRLTRITPRPPPTDPAAARGVRTVRT